MIKLLKQTTKRVLSKIGYSIRKNRFIFFEFEVFLDSYLRKNGDLFFIQIGACDGIYVDPIYEFATRNYPKVRGIVIEPLYDFFKQLEINYKKYPNIIAVNAAIHNSEKEMTLYRVDPVKLNGLPKWAKVVVSFNKNHLKLTGSPSDAIIQEKVHCISFDELLKNYQVTKIDLLQIDTEGYDAEIILNIDFNSIKPKIIRFEHGLQVGFMSKDIFLKVVDVLHKNDYELALEYLDATAYQRNIIVDLL